MIYICKLYACVYKYTDWESKICGRVARPTIPPCYTYTRNIQHIHLYTYLHTWDARSRGAQHGHNSLPCYTPTNAYIHTYIHTYTCLGCKTRGYPAISIYIYIRNHVHIYVYILCVHGWMARWMDDGRMDGWMDGRCADGWMVGWMMGSWMDGWMDDWWWMNNWCWMDGWMDGGFLNDGYTDCLTSRVALT